MNCLVSIGIGLLGTVLGWGALYSWKYIPSSWLCDYEEEETLLKKDRGTDFYTWGPVLSAVFSLGAAFGMKNNAVSAYPFAAGAVYDSVKQAGAWPEIPVQWSLLQGAETLSRLWKSFTPKAGEASDGWEHFRLAAESLWSVIFLITVLWLLQLVFLSDLKFLIIPDQLVAGLIGIAVLNKVAMGTAQLRGQCFETLSTRLLAGVVCAGAFLFAGCAAQRLSKLLLCFGVRQNNISDETGADRDFPDEGFGMGDVKLIFALGMLLGMRAGLTAIMIAALCCGTAAGVMALVGRVDRTATLPFGPYLCTAAAVTLVFLA